MVLIALIKWYVSFDCDRRQEEKETHTHGTANTIILTRKKHIKTTESVMLCLVLLLRSQYSLLAIAWDFVSISQLHFSF